MSPRAHRSVPAWCLASFLLLVAPAFATARTPLPVDPVAVVVQLLGAPRVLRVDAGQEIAVGVGTTLEPGDRLLLQPGSEVTLLHAGGRTERVTRSTTVAAPRVQGREGLLGRSLRTLRQVATTDLRQQPNREGMIRPLPGATVAVSPRNGIAVADPHPRFTWTSFPGAEGYRLQIQAENGSPTRYSAGADTVWSLPPGEPPLASGLYSWTVAPVPGGRPAAVQRFRVADAAALAALDRELQAIAQSGLDPNGSGLLLAAIAYRDAGLLYNAREALDRLAAVDGRLDRSVYLLQAEVLHALGDGEGAAVAIARAEAAGP